MIDINKIDSSQLYHDQFQKELIKEVTRIVFSLEDKQAKILADNLEKALAGFKADSELKQIYQGLMARLKFVALPRLSFKEINSLFKRNLAPALKDYDLPVLDRLKLALISINPWSRDDFKKELIIALRDNNQTLFKQNVKQGEIASIANYLKNYDQTLGTQPVEKIKQTEYLVKHFSKMESAEQESIKELFDIYEYLKITSKSPQAFEDDFIFVTNKGVVQKIKGNRLIDLRPPEKEKLTAEEIKILKRDILPGIKDPKEKQAFIQASGLANVVEDEEILTKEEIEELEKQKNPPLPPLDLNQAITEVINKTELSFSEEPLKKRFQNIVESFLRDVRSEIETRIVLKRDQKIGGLGYEDEKVDEIINILNKQKPRIKVEPKKDISPSVGLAEGIKTPEDLLQVETRMQKPEPEPEKKELESESIKDQKLEVKSEPEPIPIPIPISKPEPKPEPEPIPTPQPTPEPKQEEKELVTSSTPELKPDSQVEIPVKKEPVITEKLSGEPEKEINFVQAIDKKPQIKESKPELTPEPELEPQIIKEKKPELPVETELKPKVMIPPAPDLNQAPSQPLPAQKEAEKVKVKPKIFGPIGELQSLTLIDWRRWGTPDQAINRIEDKINLLAEESLIKKSEAIKAWKESEINKLYLGIGEESINEGMSVAEVITKRQQQSSPTLTEEEFNAVVGLNEKLRF